jgi:sporulation protein YlmC with PRC-barrel domain
MRTRRWMGMMACSAALAAGTHTLAAEPAATQPARTEVKAASGDKILAAKTFRASKLTGMNVRNMQGDELGTINDFVIDVQTGKVQYAAMSVGGLLGVGDKLFAVPFAQLKFDHGQDEMFFVLDMSKEKIAAAPGFNQSDWPDFADPRWTAKIEQHYRKTETRTGERDADQAPRDRDARIDD